MYWKDRPVEDLTRDELLEVIAYLGRQVESERELHRRSLDMLVPSRKAS